ncbi:hypothetical protein D3C87_1578110 [compost metagenome]
MDKMKIGWRTERSAGDIRRKLAARIHQNKKREIRSPYYGVLSLGPQVVAGFFQFWHLSVLDLPLGPSSCHDRQTLF